MVRDSASLACDDIYRRIEVTDKMYGKILNDPLVFGPEFGAEARSILTSLLNRDPTRRLGVNGADEIKRHPFFHKHVDFRLLSGKKIQPPFKPSVASPVVGIFLWI
jgi:serum/glucocorticoid-regulated kinase 2